MDDELVGDVEMEDMRFDLILNEADFLISSLDTNCCRRSDRGAAYRVLSEAYNYIRRFRVCTA